MRPAVWAPDKHRVQAVIADPAGDRHVDLSRDPAREGWWQLAEELPPGTRYGYLLDDAQRSIPDPRSARLPDGVHGLSEVYDEQAYQWADAAWPGRELAGAVIYELHIGTFTPAATLDSAIERLDYLVELGVSHLELLPLNAVNGIWNWGYDGVAWYAVHEPYGGPDALKRFVDACHARGLAVLLDVVHNHLGASGNYLPEFGPYLKSGRNTWGDLVNLDGEGSAEVRRYILDNALRWLRDFHLDGLRLDAVHALADESEPHLLRQLADEVAQLSAELGRPLPLIAESDLNDPMMITSADEGGHGLTAQWDDDVHHVLHAMLSGERHGYYADFGSFASLAKVFTKAFFHDGTYSAFRGRDHGKPVDTARTPGWRFVVCLQNHDQIGNRAVGDRLPEVVSAGLLKVGAVLLLTSPFTPMLFMGEEWAAGTRWPFFSSHPEPELAAAVSKGRLAEFADHGWDTASMIDPQDPAAYREAVLDWTEQARPGHAELLELYRQLIRLRRERADLADPQLDRVELDYDEQAGWLRIRRGGHLVIANLAGEPRPVPLPGPAELVLATGSAEVIGTELQLGPESAAILEVPVGP
ncbi:MAG: malto-oligosyltrehalose trehalohydrolase [Actinomycetota bacterium]|nr:malto-oligosyltrehalose trehalohydrolase [Actinomycetota bacterium]MDQ2957669.1 malto-oligosyltrehalose trehalohydrolase [Actinomycetota bacterium]